MTVSKLLFSYFISTVNVLVPLLFVAVTVKDWSYKELVASILKVALSSPETVV